MSQIRVDDIISSAGAEPVMFPHGLEIAAGYALTANQMNITGVCTATNFTGDGSAITNLPGVDASRTIALGVIA